MILEQGHWYDELLGRDLFRLPPRSAFSFAGKSVLITGGAGSIGSELVRRLCALDAAQIVVFDNAEDRLYQLHCELQASQNDRVELVLGDINSLREVERVLGKHRPQVMFHAAAHKHVDFLEGQVLAAVRTNVFGTRNVLTASLESGVESIVVLSSDKATNPISVLGATKRVAELMVLASYGQESVSAVRLCNVLGTAGSLLPMVVEQAKTGVVRITNVSADRHFVGPREAADLLLSAAGAREDGILIPERTSLLNIRELAGQIVRQVLPGGPTVRFEVTGLRPGEKLSEELYTDNEEVEASAALGLLKVSDHALEVSGLKRSIEELEETYSSGNEDRVLEKLVRVVPEFKPFSKVSTPVSQ